MNAQTEQDFNEDILQITMTIEDKFPGLFEYIGEIPIKLSDTTDCEIGLKKRSSYYDSWVSLLENYAPSHSQTAI